MFDVVGMTCGSCAARVERTLNDRPDVDARVNFATGRATVHLGLGEGGRSIVIVGVDGRAEGVIALADTLRPSAGQAVARLRREGVEVVMLTGDNRATAERVAAEAGISRVLADVQPDEKQRQIAALAGREPHGRRRRQRRACLGPADVGTAMELSRATVRKMRQNLGWASRVG